MLPGFYNLLVLSICIFFLEVIDIKTKSLPIMLRLLLIGMIGIFLIEMGLWFGVLFGRKTFELDDLCFFFVVRYHGRNEFLTAYFFEMRALEGWGGRS